MENLLKKNIIDIFELTPIQEGMLFHYLKNPGSSQYVEQLCLEISGAIDFEIFKQAWDAVIETNDALRTVFRWGQLKKPVQLVLKKYRLEPKYENITAENGLEDIKTKDRAKGFDLSQVPFRVTLCKTGPGRFHLIICYHHILLDGWSSGIILKEFFNIYRDLLGGKPPQTKQKTGFKEFVNWLLEQDIDEKKKFWSDYLYGFESKSKLPVKLRKEETGEAVNTVKTNGSARCTVFFESDFVIQLEHFAQQHKITPATFLYTAWGILLHRYNNSDDTVFGTTVSGRSAPVKGIAEIAGLFINTLPIRVQIRRGETTADLLFRIENSLHLRVPYEHTPLVNIKECSNIDNNEELFDSIVVIENYPLDRRLGQDDSLLEFRSYSMVEETHYDLTLAVTFHDPMKVDFLYNMGCFDEDVIILLSDHFSRIVRDIIAEPGKKASAVNMLGVEEKRQLLVDFNQTTSDYPNNKTMTRLFLEQVEQTPDRTVLVGEKLQNTNHKLQTSYKLQPTNYNKVHLTYMELNDRADGLAYGLKEKGVEFGAIVGLMVERSVDLIIGILAILKAGAAYLPIDADSPGERINYMLIDSRVKILVTSSNKYSDITVGEGIEIIFIEELLIKSNSTVSSSPSSLQHFQFFPAACLAYVIYTSGSTGKPKGVLISHSNICPLLYWGYDQFGLGVNDRTIQNLSYFFDWSVWEIFITLTSGAGLYIPPRELALDAGAGINFINRHAVTVLHVTPTRFQYFLQVGKKLLTLDFLFIGAEKLTYKVVRQGYGIVRQNCRIFNMYGPTEATIISSALELEWGQDANYKYLSSIPIGKPSANTLLFILDKNMNLCPVKVAGELYIYGDGAAQGYLNSPDLTNKKFLRGGPGGAVFLKRVPPGGGRQKIYKTGDSVRWLDGGNIEFLGRIDDQVKIRGYRIELGEIEGYLSVHPDIKEAVVIIKNNQAADQMYLCGYIVPNRKCTTGELQEYLSAHLPGYMIPPVFVLLERIPLTPNGKLDRKALPEPEIETGRVVVPRDEIERKLAGIWSVVLGIESRGIGIDDNFFQLGGHSLKATSVVQYISREFHVNIEIKTMFTHPSIRSLAGQIRELTRGSYERITPVEEKEYYPLSYAQRRLWVLCQFEEDSAAYNIPGAVIFNGAFNDEMFSRAVQALADRHESLRTVFISLEGEPRQKILKEFTFNLARVDLSHKDAMTKIEKTREIYLGDANRAFDLEHGPLFMFKVIRWEEKKNVLIHNMHHIVDDGWSQGIVINEIVAFYNGLSEKRGGLFSTLQFQYKDYTQWHNRLIDSDSFKNSRKYWLGKCHDKPNGIELPVDHPRKAVQTFNGGRVDFLIDEEKISGLDMINRKEDATLFMSLLTLVSIFLHRITGQTDIIIGAPVANRRRIELHPLIGFFVNTLVYRSRVMPEQGFREQLKAIKEEALTCYEYQDYPFDLLVEQLEPDRDLSQSPIFNVMLAHNNAETQDLKLAMKDIRISPYPHSGEFNMSKFDLIFFMDEVDNEVNTRIEYNSDLFERSSIERMRDNFLALVEDVISRKDISISSLNILCEAELERVTREFNDTGVSFEHVGLTVGELFEEQVLKSGDKSAVIGIMYGTGKDGGSGKELTGHMTYRLLNKKVNQLAHFLIEEYGVKPNDVIGLSMERSIEMINVLLGVIKSGAAYLAVDPTYPRERVLHVLADSRASLLITDELRPELYENFRGIIINILDLRKHIAGKPDKNPGVKNQPADILYVNYTSGSTGIPNGAMLSHDILRNLVQWQTGQTSIDCSLRCLQFTSINFCVSFQEIIGTLCAGGELFLIGDIERQDIDYLMDFLCRYQIENLFLPFSYLNFLFNESDRWDRRFNHNLKHIITAGEQLKITMGLKRFLDLHPHLQLHNHYGSTEMHVVTSYTLNADSAELTPIPPAGKPISNVKIYILDDHMNPVPVGVWGELLVSGNSEVLGYINNDELTEEKLVNHPVLSIDGQRLYRSGDVGRWLADGNIELRGRKDFLVKIRGFRVEPGEIEGKLLSVKGIRECVVVVKQDLALQEYLAAYIVKDGIDTAEIKQHLGSQLPQYMIPKFVVLDSLPLMPNGKVDREGLPEPGLNREGEYVAPVDAVEEKLVNIWSELLGMPGQEIGVESNFFQLGGHSLKATLLVARMHKTFNVKLPLLEVFTSPNIRELAGKIKGMVENRFTGIIPCEKKEYYALSSAQERLYVLQQMDRNSIAYNMPSVLELETEAHREKLEKAFRGLLTRHESLRTSFRMVAGEPVQRVHEEAIIGKLSLMGREVVEGKIDDFIPVFLNPFDLAQAPLLRVGLFHAPGDRSDRYVLMIDMHHIISDGMSMDIFVREFKAFYGGEGEKLPRMKIQYKDFSVWQNREKKCDSMQQQALYWQRQFKSGIPALNLPADYIRPTVQSFSGSTLAFAIAEEDTRSLTNFALGEGTTLFMVLLSIYTIFLSKLSGQEDIVVGTPVAGRRHTDLEPIVGMFVNTLALRNFPVGEYSFRQFLHQVKNRALEAFANQDYPYEELVETVVVERDASRNPLFDTMFALQNMDIADLEIPGLKLRRYDEEISMKIAKFDLTLIGIESSGQLVFTFEYCTKLFARETIGRFIHYFQHLVSGVLVNPNEKIPEMEIISGEEKQRIMYEFNDTATEYPVDETIDELFLKQVERTADHTALVESNNRIKNPKLQNKKYKNMHLSYKELNNYTDRLAQSLVESGVKPDTLVGIKGGRSVEAIIGILGILKARGAYLPIDAEYPRERIDYMIADANIIISVANSDIFNKKSSPNFYLRHSPRHVASLAYVNYTSGTSGRPKGVMVTHQNVVRLVKGSNFIEFEEGERILPTGALEFDASTFEIWGALLNGLTLCLVGKAALLAADRLGESIRKYNIGIMWMTAPLFSQMIQVDVEIFSGLKSLLVGGDVLLPDHINRLKRRFPGLNVINGYGPTENTTFSTTFLIDIEYPESIPIGKPISNSTVYIVDSAGRLQPTGIPGELWVGGDGVARGYLNNPGLTFERFVNYKLQNTNYKQITNITNQKLLRGVQGGSFLEKSPPGRRRQKTYKTGDSGRWLWDGNIESLGRIDHQVKVRGFRIELGEIESQILKHKKIKEAIVIDRKDDGGDRHLCAYVVPDLPGIENELRDFLSLSLPHYMIPSYIIPLERLPLTSSGKVNRSALPRPEAESLTEYKPPRDEVEKRLVEIWSGVLGREVGIGDNFFHIGGDSIKAIRISARLREHGLSLEITDLFLHPVISQLGRCVKKIRPGIERGDVETELNGADVIDTCCREISQETLSRIKDHITNYIGGSLEIEALYPLSPTQRAMLYYSISGANKDVYFIRSVFRWEGTVEMTNLELSVNKLVARHSIFRTTFIYENLEEPLQVVLKERPVRLGYKDITDLEESEQILYLEEAGKKDMKRGFDLSKDILVRVTLFRVGMNSYYLLWSHHYILTDGWCMGIIFRELVRMYEGFRTGNPVELEKATPYREYIRWLERRDKSAGFCYWENYLAGYVHRGDLIPTGAGNPINDDASYFEEYTFEIGQEEIEALKGLAAFGGVTLNMVFQTLWGILLQKYNNRDDVVFGAVVSGRPPEIQGIESMVGLFINTVPVRVKTFQGENFSQLLRMMQENSTASKAYEYLPLTEILAKLEWKGNIIDNLMTFQNFLQLESAYSTGNLEQDTAMDFKAETTLYHESNYNFNVVIIPLTPFQVKFMYNAPVYEEDLIKRMAGHLKEIIGQVIVDRDIKIKDILVTYDYIAAQSAGFDEEDEEWEIGPMDS